MSYPRSVKDQETVVRGMFHTPTAACGCKTCAQLHEIEVSTCTKASGARLEFSLALAVVAVKVWKTTDRVDYISHVGGSWGGGGGASTVILSQQSKGLEGGGGSTEILSQKKSRFGGGEGGRGGSSVILSARGFVGITSCSVGNCIVTSCLVVASKLSQCIALTCSWYESITITILFHLLF